MAAYVVSASTEFDIFASRPVKTSTLETIEIAYKQIDSLDQIHLEFLIPADHDTYVDLNIQLYIRGKFVKADGTDLDDKDHTCVVHYLLHSLFEQCNVSLNGVKIPMLLNFIRPTVAMQPRHVSQTRSSIAILVIRPIARIHPLKRPVQTRGASRDATE